ncbi:uncharacterized protein LOC144104212 isoform X2 [Amblyomma americanum]
MTHKHEQIEYMLSLLHDAGLSPTNFDLRWSETIYGCSEEDITRLHKDMVPIAGLVSVEEEAQLFDDVRMLVQKLRGHETDQSRFRMYSIMATRTLKR